MPFVPVPSAEVCDLSSRSSRYFAQSVCRTWHNLQPSTWHRIPETIDLRPDGSGTISSPFSLYTAQGKVSHVASQEFTWKLTRDGPLGMEGIDWTALYETMPKLMKSTKAWTLKPWTAAGDNIIPTYLRINLKGEHSLCSMEAYHNVNDFNLDRTQPGVQLPVEIIEYIVDMASSDSAAPKELLYVCKWTREIVLNRRRKEMFATMAKRFVRGGLAFWIYCGHYNPPGNPHTGSFFAFQASVSKMPGASGYNEPEDWPSSESPWDDNVGPRIYYSGELPIPEDSTSALGLRLLKGQIAYDEHPEVAKDFS